MTDQGSFEYESYQDIQSIQKFLTSLSEEFKQGKVTLSSGEKAIELLPSGLLKFKILAKKKEKGSKLQIRITWHEEEDITTNKLTIGS